MDFYAQLELALFSADSNTKELIVNEAIEYLKECSIPESNYVPKVQETPSYSNICTIVAPKDLPKRGDFRTDKALLALVHSIAHIEFSAIDLAIDAVYRFPSMPQEYKLDWLIVAQDEIRHFKMLKTLLGKLGVGYGALPVHKGLFEMAYKTKDSVLERMAVIPRYFEASGLDVNPKIITKLQNYKGNVLIQELIEALNIIYNEEIDHVYKGDKWFKFLCNKRGVAYEREYLDIIKKYNLKSRAAQFNIEGRREAGFSCHELKNLGAKECS